MAQPATGNPTTGNKGTAKKEKKMTGWHALLWICCFFGVMFIANGFFVYYANTSFPGVVEESPYQASQNYNTTLKEAAAQASRDWDMGLQLRRRANEVFLVITARDSMGNPIDDLTILANVGRPATESYDHNLTMQTSGEGVYQSNIGALDPGRWRVSFEATQNDETMFQSIDTVTLD